jgi:DedD protein
VKDFWVQTGSFANKSRADKARHFLSDKGIVSIVTNSLVNGGTFYRVRVGPYASKAEANYWLGLIKEIDGFEKSQVWESARL